MRTTFLPFALPSIGEEEIAEVVDSLRSGWVTTGPKVKRFEADFAAYVGCSHALAVNSCTAGLHIALAAIGVGPGDEVIVPSLTFCSTANVVIHLGARPVLVEVEDDLTIAPQAVADAITPRTRAIMPVHHSGQACNLDAIYALAADHRLAVIEDAAHATGTRFRSQHVGARGLRPSAAVPHHAVVFSFYAIKTMTTGEGGMIVTEEPELADTMRRMTLHGMSRDAWKRYTSAGSWYYEVLEAGYKANMTDVQAAIGIHQLQKLDGFVAARQRLAAHYDQAFAAMPELITPRTQPDRNHVYHLYVLRLALDRLTIGRDAFIEELRMRQIGTSVHFIPVHLHPFYQERGWRRGDLPRTEALFDSMLSLPLYPRMSDDDLQSVIAAVADIVALHRR